MIKTDLSGKRLLLIGGIGACSDLITLAHRNGVFIGVADYNKDTPVKRMADAAYEINALDIDAITELCRQEHYDGIISNFSDMLSPYVTQAAERLGMPVPYTIEQLRLSTDKKYFKDTLIRYGIPVPREYPVRSEDDVDTADIDYPVIVKPVDGSGSRGISVCRDAEALKNGLRKAMEVSRSKNVIVEAFIPDDEINVTYIAQDGDIQLAAIHDRYFNTTQEGVVRVPDMYIYPSRYTGIYLEKYNQSVIRMLKDLGIRNGSLFMQACVRNNEVFFYEAGMRLNGCKTYQILELENDYNTFEHLMCYALTGSMDSHCTFDARLSKWYATWNVVGRPGAVCSRFYGLQELESYPWLIKIARRYSEGEQIPSNSKGTLIQLLARIHVFGETKEQLLERIDKMQHLFHVTDENGSEVLFAPHSVNDLRNKLDYDR